jgi:beta-glucosidase
MTLTGGTAHPDNAAALLLAEQYVGTKNVVGILLSGRPLLLDNNLNNFDSFIAAWLPGTEGGHGISDVIFGDYDFQGKLSYTWPATYEQIGFNSMSADYDPAYVLFPYGYGLTYSD